ncbi:cyclopropane fatty acyl phospholipid synthase [Patescibacteria group bacterium]|nr:cyclopropane fatty acyl phospholipid synthase [Patescibacteria group bacterium]MBU1673868.1 cyclopropane fatty acyl phospholipid synthase [Patescibacteria group bacterium]MBU1963245.1 cyclopropane fatty acyl phospholipid synthase [Patescibacteria group bacterium]
MSEKNIDPSLQKLLDLADVKINGNRPWDMQVHNPKLFQRILAEGSLGLGEAYMDEWWDSEAVDELINRFLKSDADKKLNISPKIAWLILKAKILNQQNKIKAHEVIKKHYDIGNDLYQKMLDKSMAYTCGYWKNADNLEDAQAAKHDLICRKLKIEPGMTLLDIGCGWGSLIKYAAEKYKAKAIGITLSKEQARLAKKLCQGLNVEIKIMDYRALKEKFDRIVSVGMFEHVGYKNHYEYFNSTCKSLKDNGLMLLHTIAGNTSVKNTNAWLDKYIFPNAVLPSAKQITTAYEGLFRLEDWHNFGTYYDNTLMAWHKNFNDNWDKIKDNYDERFFRMWNYYLLTCAGTFRSHRNQLWQIVFSKTSSQRTYESCR